MFHPHITILVLICLIFNKSKFKLILSWDHTLQYLESDATLDVQCQNYIELQPTDVETEYMVMMTNIYISFVQLSLSVLSVLAIDCISPYC